MSWTWPCSLPSSLCFWSLPAIGSSRHVVSGFFGQSDGMVFLKWPFPQAKSGGESLKRQHPMSMGTNLSRSQPVSAAKLFHRLCRAGITLVALASSYLSWLHVGTMSCRSCLTREGNTDFVLAPPCKSLRESGKAGHTTWFPAIPLCIYVYPVYPANEQMRANEEVAKNEDWTYHDLPRVLQIWSFKPIRDCASVWPGSVACGYKRANAIQA